MTPEISQRLANAVDAMPAFPQSVQKILAMTRDVNCTPKDLVDVIDKDPVITIKVLKVVNSAHYSLPRQITSIGHAVVYLGFNPIKNLAVTIAAIGMLPKSNAAAFDIQQYLLHSLATAGLAKHLAQKYGKVDPMDCFIAGLLHDFGKVVLAQFMPEEFKAALLRCQKTKCSLHTALQQEIGIDHATTGAMLLEKWNFAPDLVSTVRHQHVLNYQDSDMAACVFGANQISKKLKFGFGGNPFYDEFPPAVRRRLGGTLDELIVALGDLDPIFEEAKMFAVL